MPAAVNGEKICAKCRKIKPISEFQRQSKTKDGYNYWCRSCNSNYATIRYRKSRENLTCIDCGKPLERHCHKYCRKCAKVHKKIATEVSHLRKQRAECCIILQKHHVDLQNDPERLSTNFIKRLSGCECK